jgi:hydrogenase nickel incorporation protein HypA/HybF
MHELSIAMAIVESVEEAIAAYPGTAVRRVVIEVGELSGVVPEALEFSWSYATENTALAAAALQIEPGANPRDLILRSVEMDAPTAG